MRAPRPDGPLAALLAAGVLAATVLAAAAILAPPPTVAPFVSVAVQRCSGPPDGGGGTLVGPGMVLTAAHVLDDVDEATVLLDDRSVAVTAASRLNRADLALLRLAEAVVPAELRIRPLRPDDAGVLHGPASARPVPFEVTRRARITLRPIAAGAVGLERLGAELRATVQRGDSGAGLLADDGHLIGVLFARSTDDPHRAWASDITEAGGLLGEGPADEVDAVPLNACPR